MLETPIADEMHPLGFKTFTCNICGYESWESHQDPISHNKTVCSALQSLNQGQGCPHPDGYIKSTAYGRKFCNICNAMEPGHWKGTWK